MDFTELAQARYSVRKFSDKAVEPEVLKRILEAGLLAPTAKNNQPQRIYVLQSKEALDKLDTGDEPVTLLPGGVPGQQNT